MLMPVGTLFEGTDLSGLLSSRGSSPVLPSSTGTDGTCFLGKKSSHVPWDKQVQGHAAEREMVQPLQPARGSAWRKLCVDFCWRAPKKLCLVTCIQCQRENFPV